MRIIITDTGRIWNPDNPFLETVKDVVLVVCLNGKKVTDKYECFVSPYKPVGMGADKYGIEDMKYRALASVAKELNQDLRYYEDIVFLTDNEITTLYPFDVLKNKNKFNKFHLVTSSPFEFEGKKRLEKHSRMLNDLSALTSFLYYDSNTILNEFEKPTMDMAYKGVTDYFGKILPTILNGINDMRYEKTPYYFDFSSMKYVSLKNGFKDIDITKSNGIDNELDFHPHRYWGTLGLVCAPSYPEAYKDIHETIERPVPRPDGKQVCNLLREQRIHLAKANNIPFESEECQSTGPCAGTCAKCDSEAEYLRRQMKKIPEEKRVYP